jgi:hypothetical protein
MECIRGVDLALLYEILVRHDHSPKNTFVMYDWIEKKPSSSEDMLQLLEEHLIQRSVVGCKIIEFHAVSHDAKRAG